MADAVQVRLHERIRLLEEIIENMESAELPELPLVVHPIHAAVTGIHAGP